MNREATKQLIEGEFVNILAAKFGISGDEEAVEILRNVVFPGSRKKEDASCK